jgi:hypothetical protein
MMGVLLQQAGLGWDVVPDWAGQLYGHLGWMVEFLAGASIVDMIQQGYREFHKRYIKEKDVL